MKKIWKNKKRNKLTQERKKNKRNINKELDKPDHQLFTKNIAS